VVRRCSFTRYISAARRQWVAHRRLRCKGKVPRGAETSGKGFARRRRALSCDGKVDRRQERRRSATAWMGEATHRAATARWSYTVYSKGKVEPGVVQPCKGEALNCWASQRQGIDTRFNARAMQRKAKFGSSPRVRQGSSEPACIATAGRGCTACGVARAGLCSELSRCAGLGHCTGP